MTKLEERREVPWLKLDPVSTCVAVTMGWMAGGSRLKQVSE